MRKPGLPQLLRDVRACRLCASELSAGVRPIVQVHRDARILIAGQAPGRRVHESGVPFDDPSGDRLREWMGVSRQTFYDARRISILPMGFCYPGAGKSGDLPPRPECAETWRQALLERLPAVELTLVIGLYALRWHLPEAGRSLTEAVREWRAERPARIPLPHPSPRNNLWFVKNPWFEIEVLPYLRRRVRKLLRT
jgi:uracil-DNA glycosylase